jgi:PAS domain S-box-containing protein
MTVESVPAKKPDTRRAHLEVALASTADAVIAVDSAGNIVYLNSAAELLTAWTSGDASGLPLHRCFKIVHDDSGAALENVFDTVRRSADKIEFSGHTALVNRRGRLLPIECSVSPLRDNGGAFAGAVIVFRDVGGRRAAERALQSSEESRAENADALFEEKERAQVTLNSIGDAVVSTNFWGRVTYLNIVAERMTGWSQAQASGRAVDDVFKLIDVTSRSPIPTPAARAIIENRTVGLGADCMLVRGDGVELAVESSAAPIHDRSRASCPTSSRDWRCTTASRTCRTGRCSVTGWIRR